jgi:rubrerythrin
MGRPHWTLDDIPWDRFDRSKVDPEVLKLAKAASVVEHNGHDYARYLGEVFHDDPEFQAVARQWAAEEVQHGQVLARWAKLADPGFDFDAAFERFTKEIKLPAGIEMSVRGSRVGELVARCMVEVGTSSYYSALMAGTEEPVLKEICRRIASDEFRHYKMFYDNMKRYLDRDAVGFWSRVRIGISRVTETEDDELAFAYYTTNHPNDGPYARTPYRAAYMVRAYRFYKPGHFQLAFAMILKALGVRASDWLLRRASELAYLFIRGRALWLARAAA